MQLKVSMLGIEEKIMALLLLGLMLNVGSGVSATNECREAGNHGAIAQHGGGEGIFLVWKWIRPLASSMPVCGSFLQASTWSTWEVKASLDEMEASFIQRSNSLSVLRRRFHSR